MKLWVARQKKALNTNGTKLWAIETRLAGTDANCTRGRSFS